MPRDGAIIVADLTDKLDVMYVHCPKCSRAGRYHVQHLIEERGRNAKLIDWLDEITADCPKKQAHNMNDACGARFPDLPKVLLATSTIWGRMPDHCPAGCGGLRGGAARDWGGDSTDFNVAICHN